jgi:predicted transcriptional regulator YdeE
MPKIHIDRSIEISADVSEIFQVLIDFSQWKDWSPWLILDPKAKMDISPEGDEYQWEGSRVGKGKMTITGYTPNKEAVYQLAFFKPFKSNAVVAFQIEHQGSVCVLHWIVDSSLPFYLSWLKKPMLASMTYDYDRGLKMLKDYVEHGEVPSRVYEEGLTEYRGCQYVGITTECTMEEMEITKKSDFDELTVWIDNEEVEVYGEPLTIYHMMDLVKKTCAFTVAVPVAEIPDHMPRPLHSGSIPKLTAFKFLHEGPYHHLGNCWALAEAMTKNKEIRLKKGFPPFEIYESDTQDTADELLETAIYFPVAD